MIKIKMKYYINLIFEVHHKYHKILLIMCIIEFFCSI